MVKVTLEFPTVDQAIVALGKLALTARAADKPVTVPNPKALSDADVKAALEGVPASKVDKTRKPRADAGKPRGKYNKDAGARAPTKPSEQASNGPNAVTDPGKEADKAIVPTSTPAAATNAPAQNAKPAVEAGTKGSGVGPGAGDVAAAAVTDPRNGGQKAPTVKSTPAAVATATQEEVQAAIEALFAATDINVTRAVLARFGAKRGQDLLPEHRADFIKLANDVREGKAQP